MLRLFRGTSSLLLILVAACSARALPGGMEPARLFEPSTEVRAELTRLVSESLGGVAVTLGEQALTDSSILVVERAVPRDLQQRPLQGRSLEVPVRFQLLVGGERCWLKRLPEGPVLAFDGARCVPEAALEPDAGG